MTFNAGVQFALRNQDSLYSPSAAGMATATMDAPNAPLRTIDATHYTTDLWLMLRYRGLRIEGEVAWVAGSMDNLTAMGGANEYTISQVGYALETELRLVDDKLTIIVLCNRDDVVPANLALKVADLFLRANP